MRASIIGTAPARRRALFDERVESDERIDFVIRVTILNCSQFFQRKQGFSIPALVPPPAEKTWVISKYRAAEPLVSRRFFWRLRHHGNRTAGGERNTSAERGMLASATRFRGDRHRGCCFQRSPHQ